MGHEKLDCYRLLLEVAKGLDRIMRGWPRGYGYVADQARRAMASAVLNLVEGNGKRRYGPERRRFFRISLGSISEVAACLDLASIYSLISAEGAAELKGKLEASYFMIRKLP